MCVISGVRCSAGVHSLFWALGLLDHEVGAILHVVDLQVLIEILATLASRRNGVLFHLYWRKRVANLLWCVRTWPHLYRLSCFHCLLITSVKDFPSLKADSWVAVIWSQRVRACLILSLDRVIRWLLVQIHFELRFRCGLVWLIHVWFEHGVLCICGLRLLVISRRSWFRPGWLYLTRRSLHLGELVLTWDHYTTGRLQLWRDMVDWWKWGRRLAHVVFIIKLFGRAPVHPVACVACLWWTLDKIEILLLRWVCASRV